MKLPFNVRAPAFDADAINDTIQRALASAGLDTQAGPMRDVTQTIRRALGAGHNPPEAAGLSNFQKHDFSNAAGTRAYKVYVPAGSSVGPRPMVVMLHGCTQSADDFAAGTQMNRLADEHGFLVVYPEQSAQANPSKCWNWFQPQDQLRDSGEPSLIAGIVREVVQQQGADTGRIFVAGLSAGAAMAVVLGETYPDVFAGVGAHSGLPYRSAHDVQSALGAMKGGRSGMPGLNERPGEGSGARRKPRQAVPVIVFHGDRDHTVQQSNGRQIERQAQAAHDARGGRDALHVSSQTGVAPGGRHFTRTDYRDTAGQARIESWTLHGAGHAWSGGHASGSYTDAAGPDASAEMMRFFLALPAVSGGLSRPGRLP
jgi:poly(hydroxyalkanoate) depolymerase family esterase